MAFMVLTNSGHTAIAKSIKDQVLFLAWGDLPGYLPAPTGLTLVAGTTTPGVLGQTAYQYKVTAITDAGETEATAMATVTPAAANSSVTLTWTPVAGSTGYRVYGRLPGDTFSFIVEVTAATYVDTGSVAVTSSIVAPSANTTSANPWTNSAPNPSVAHRGLFRELGRRKIVLTKYVKPDTAGPYVTTQGRWSESTEPTKHVYGYAAFDLTDAASSTIYQYGVFIGTVPITGYENAQYLNPGQVQVKGSLLSIENVSPIIRNSSTREVYEIVMTF